MMNTQIMSNINKKEAKVNLIKDKGECLKRIIIKEFQLIVNKEIFLRKRN